uniref:Genome polyprotein n=1 Tax=Watson virus TaxID=2600333 RepID=A0A5B8XB29_9PICO|nr:polyprotein [Watson virus]
MASFKVIQSRDYLQEEIERLENLLDFHLSLKKTCLVFIETISWCNKLRDICIKLDVVRTDLRDFKAREDQWIEFNALKDHEYELDQARLLEQYKLPDISVYATENLYDILDNEECNISYDEVDFIPKFDILTRPRKFDTYVNDWQYSKDYFRKQAIRDTNLLSKLKSLINILSFNRKTKNLVPYFNDFVIQELDLSVLFVKPYNWKSAMAILEYKRNNIHLLKSTELPIEMEEVRSDEFSVFDPDEIQLVKFTKDSNVENQMDNEGTHGDCEDLNVDKKENVVITSHTDESVSDPIDVSVGKWERLCSSQVVQEYTQLMSRWQRYDTFRWNTSQAVNTELVSIEIFKDLITKFSDSPNCILFKQYAYFRSDVEIKIVVNSNRFQIGSLMGYFYYGAKLDNYFKDRNNVYSASQISHVVIDAANSSDGILKIPYRHYKPLSSTISRGDDKEVMNIGLFKLLVLNELQTTDTSNINVDVSIFYRFVNPSFHGMKPRTIENQMLGVKAIVNDTANLLNQVFPDPQRDNPSDIRPAQSMIPWSAHSWSLGDKISEPINPLRLQATGNTPHPPGTLPSEPEMSIDYIKQIYGLFSIIKWETSQVSGTILTKIPFSPILDIYPTTTVKNPDAYDALIMPPVSVLSQLFAYWRGSLNYKLDFISSFVHTGRLIVSYLPRAVLSRDPTLPELTACDHIIIDLRDEKQVSYTCHFLSDKPWWPRRSVSNSATETYPPGYIYIAVMNQLTNTTAVTDRVYINMYLRAGVDFELHVPCAPKIGLSFNTKIKKSSDTLCTYLPSYGPPNTGLYIGSWHTISGKLTLRYGTASDQITQFDKKYLLDKVYKLVGDKDLIYYRGGVKVSMPYLVLYTDLTYVYGAPFSTYDKANNFKSIILRSKYELKPEAIPYMEAGDGKDGDWATGVVHYWNAVTSLDGFNLIEAQAGEERDSNCGTNVAIHSNILSTNNGLYTFGEQISSLKQLIRRYQPYAHVLTPDSSTGYYRSLVEIPLLPQGLDLEFGDNSNYVNMLRDGPIPIIASGYRFYRGSMRLRILFDGSSDAVCWLQHKPDVQLKRLVPRTISNKDDIDSYFNPGYAYLIQDTSINRIMEVEIPFYLPGQFGMLQRPNLDITEDATHYSLGVLNIGTEKYRSKDMSTVRGAVQVFYSCGDDMSFSVFQGYPPMVDLSIFVPKVENQMMKYFKEKCSDKMADVAVDAIDKTKERLLKNDNVQDDATASSISDLIKTHVPELTGEKRMLIVHMFTNLVHSLLNPDVKTLAWSFASILVSCGLLAMTYLQKICNNFLKLFTKWTDKDDKKEEASTSKSSKKSAKGKVQSQADVDQPEAALVSTMIAGMLALVGASNKPIPKTIPDFASYLYDGMPKFTLTANGLFTFLKNNIKMLKNVWYWLVAKFNKDYIIYAELDNATEDVILFIKQIQWCLDSSNSDKVETDLNATAKVYKLANIAQSYLAKRAVSSVQKTMPIFDNYCRKIIELKDKLVAKKKSPPVRFEPYVLCFVGHSNIGKSHMSRCVLNNLLDSIDYKCNSERIYVRNPANAYWNGCVNQPACLFDDYLNITDNFIALPSIGELYALKSKAVFNPPMAAIPEKELRYNPLLVCLLMNKSFPALTGVAYPEAFYRRRDLMWHVEIKSQYIGIHPRHLSSDVKKHYKHLTFYRYLKPGAMDAQERQYDKEHPCSYGEMLAESCKLFNEYFLEECEQYNSAISEIAAHLPDPTETVDEHLKSLENTVKRINQDRSPNDVEEINRLMKIAKEREYRCDLSNFVNKKILTKKCDELKQIQKEHKDKINKRSLLNEISMLMTTYHGSADVEFRSKTMEKVELLRKKYQELFKETPEDFFTTKLNDIDFSSDGDKPAQASSSNNIQDQISVEVIPESMSLIDLTEDSETEEAEDCIKWAKPPIIEEQGMDYIIGTPNNLSPQPGETCVKYKGLPLCGCVYMLQFANMFDYTYYKNVNGFIYRGAFKCHKNGAVVKISTEPCEANCVFKLSEVETVTLLSKLNKTRTIITVADQYLDKTWLALKKCYQSENDVVDVLSGKKVVLTTPEEIDNEIEKEVADKCWFQKLWEKLPAWGTIFGWICKIGLIVGALAGVVSFFTSIVKNSCESKSKIKETAYKEKYFDNNIVRENEVSITLAKQWTDIHNDFRDTSQQESYTTGTIGAKANKKIPIAKPKAQACAQQEDVIFKYIKRNTFWLSLEFETETGYDSRLFRCLGLVGKYFLFLDHYYNFMKSKPNAKLFYIQQGMYIEIPLSVVNQNIQTLTNSTFMIGKMHKTIPHFANIIKLMIKQEASGNIAPQAKLYEYKLNSDREFMMQIHHIDRIYRQDRLEVNNDDGSVSRIGANYEYPVSGRGVCGSVLVSSSNMNAPILGIHVAGIKNGIEGYAEALVYESFSFLLNSTTVIEENSYDHMLVDKRPKLNLDGNILQLGVVDKRYAQHVSEKSRIIPTENHGILTPVTYDIPVLSAKDNRIKNAPFSPLLEGCKHHTNPCKDMNLDYVIMATDHLENKLLTYVQPQRLQIGKLSILDAIDGFHENVLYEPMVMDTSEGFPWILDRPPGVSNKSWLFDRTLTPTGFITNAINDNLLSEILRKEDLRKNNIIPATIFSDCLKDAKLPLEKVLSPGKTRIFSICPVDFTIAIRQYTYDFVVAYQYNRIKTEHAVGIDIYSRETHKMVEYMLEYGNNMICGDYSKFGDQLYAICIHKVFKIILNWYIKYGVIDVEEYTAVMKIFSYEVSNAIHLVLDLLYQCVGGMPSGNPITVIINSMVNSLYIRIAWISIMVNQSLYDYLSLTVFDENVRMITYGDDLWISVKDDFRELFNTLTLMDHFAKYNIKFTNALKDGNMIKYAPLTDSSVTFLKCTFRKHDYNGLWVANMEKRVIEETCNWCWNTNRDVRESSLTACSAMLELAYSMGREYHTNLRSRVLSYWQSKGVYLSVPTWDEIDLRIYS